MALAGTVEIRSPARPRRPWRTEDVLVLLSPCLALLLAAGPALQYVPLSHALFGAFSVALDAIFVLHLSAALTVIQRRRALGALLALVIVNSVLAASCLKLLILGETGLLADLLLVPDLLRVLDPLPATAAAVVGAAVAGAWLANCGRPRNLAEAVLAAPLAAALLYLTLLASVPALAQSATNGLPLPARGFPATGHFYTAYGTFARNADWTHTLARLQAASDAALRHRPLRRAILPPFASRNVHIVVAESFTDPAWYPRYGLSEAPMPPLFERWRAGPASTALSPVFGGRSSNAEFEVLCGVPAAVGSSEVVFWRVGAHPLPCLPRLLAGRGYQSLSLVPNSPVVFNASVAYRSFGFTRSIFGPELDMSDLDGTFLSAEATLAQHLEQIEPRLRTDVPLFSYVFVNANHYPYERDAARRPTVLLTTPADPSIEAYVNGAYYAALAIDRFVEHLRARDPQSLIVILGDHAPPLGPNFAGYRRGGRIPPDSAEPFQEAAI